jgi:large subunit ribosomal protein L16
MMQPKRSKFRKAFKGRIHGDAKGGYALNFGEFGLKAMEPERVTARQIEAARRALTRHMKRAGRVWIRVSPTCRCRRSRSKCAWARARARRNGGSRASLRAGSCSRIDGVPESLAREAFGLAAAKLPIKTRFVQRIAE